MENIGTLNFEILGLIKVSSTGLGIIAGFLLVVLIVPKLMRARK